MERGNDYCCGCGKREEGEEMAAAAPTTKNGMDLEAGEVINGRFVVEVKLGQGGFGAVYRMRELNDQSAYAMKVEMKPKEGERKRRSNVKLEVMVLKALNAGQKKRRESHACQILVQGQNDQFRYVIMTLLGPSLQDMKKKLPGGHFKLSTAVRVGIQCLHAIQDLHEVGFIHRDIKPANFAIGTRHEQKTRIIFLIDFGLAREYRKLGGELKAPRDGAGFRGTTRYAPVRCHEMRELFRADDLEMWFYQQVEMTVGKLPWSRIKEKVDICNSKKMSRLNGKLFEGCPSTYAYFLSYIDHLQYWDDPGYHWIEDGLRHTVKTKGFSMDDPYDWETEKTEKTTNAPNANRPPEPEPL